MKSRHYIKIICVLLLTILLGSTIHSQGKKIVSTNRNEQFLELVKNACVTRNAMDDMDFCFKNGKYVEKVASGSPIEITLLEPIIFARFNSEPLEYAIAPMSYYGGGNSNGLFCLILVFVYQDNKAVQVSYGDVLKDGILKDVKVKNDTIIVELSDGDSTNTERFLYRTDHLINLDKQ